MEYYLKDPLGPESSIHQLLTVTLIDNSPACLKHQQSASGLVVKFNVAIVEPPVRFRACAIQHSIRDSLVARISACHAGDRGSIPRLGVAFFSIYLLCQSFD